MPIRPTLTVSGKPTEKTPICGATREITPSTRLTNISIVISGSAIHSPMVKISAPQRCGMAARRKAKGSVPTGKLWKLCTSALMSSRWPLMAMNRNATMLPKKRALAVPWAPVPGSKNPAKFRPICRPISSPANSSAANTSRTANPMDRPISSCWATSSVSMGSESSGVGGMAGSEGCAATAMKSDRPTRRRSGTARWLKVGMPANRASVRMKGHRRGLSHSRSWASVTENMAWCCSVRACRLGACCVRGSWLAPRCRESRPAAG